MRRFELQIELTFNGSPHSFYTEIFLNVSFQNSQVWLIPPRSDPSCHEISHVHQFSNGKFAGKHISKYNYILSSLLNACTLFYYYYYTFNKNVIYVCFVYLFMKVLTYSY